MHSKRVNCQWVVWALSVAQRPLPADQWSLTSQTGHSLGQVAESGAPPMAADSLSKNALSGGNCSLPDRPSVIDTEANHSDSIPSDWKSNLAEMVDDSLADNSKKWVALAGKDCT